MTAKRDSNKRVLIVDDDEDILMAGKLLLKKVFSTIITCIQPNNIPAVMAEQYFDVILLDMNFSPGENKGEKGFVWLKKILEIDPDVVVVMITAHAGVNVAVEAMKHGAADFIAKPWQNEKVVATMLAAIQLRESRLEAKNLKRSNQLLVENSGNSQQNILGHSQAMSVVHSIIRRTAPTDANVLILGENGTGKELVAREIYQHSSRADNVFMSVDLGAISETLFESELFGHKKGAFTGAFKDRVGRLVAANNGTLFLDEIGNIPLHLQAKLLTVLEQRKVTPLGSNESITIDIRVIAATNIAKKALSDEKKFRQDLLFRLNTVEILLPPLRDRVEDIPEIANYYARLYSRKYTKPEKCFSSDTINAMKCYHWPGNVRALRHAMERAVILSEGDTIESFDLQLDSINLLGKNTEQENSNQERGNQTNSLNKSSDDFHLERMEKRLVKSALTMHGYNISKAAKELGLTRAALYRRMEKYDF